LGGLSNPEYCNTIPEIRRPPMPNSASREPRTAVLLSGGLDSAVLLADEASRGEVVPIYIRAGLAWEAAEQAAVDALLDVLRTGAAGSRLHPLVPLAVDMADVYSAAHWAVAGQPPGYHTADEEVYLPGRNIVLLAKAAVYCASAAVGRLVLGTLGQNPFPDATDGFRRAMATALSLGLAHPLTIDAPYADLDKTAVIRRGAALQVPFELTISCMNPVIGTAVSRVALHCGVCSKCRERHDAFLDAQVPDPTPYVETTFVERGRSSPAEPGPDDPGSA
jgi:7-cyano-7-deazaguanine synthase